MNILRFAHIGAFDIVSGTIDIADPYINPITVAVERIPVVNEKMIKVSNMLCGMYDAYHVQECYDGQPTGLLLLHNAYSLKDIENKKGLYGLGYASSNIGGGIVAVDEALRYSTKYCYYPIEGDAYYNSDLILSNLDNMKYDDIIKQRLRELIENTKSDNWLNHPKGEDIMNAIGDLEPIWSGFTDFNNGSSQWSVDIMNRMNASYTKAAVIKSGVISSTAIGFNACYKYLNSRLNVYAVYISLKRIELDENSIWNPNELPDFTLDNVSNNIDQ